MSDTANWKRNEKVFSQVYQKMGIPAERVIRLDYGKSDIDVRIEGAEWVRSDAKWSRMRPFRHHGLMYEGEGKYCQNPEDQFVLFTKNYNSQDGFITVRAEFFAKLLSFWLGCKSKEELEQIK